MMKAAGNLHTSPVSHQGLRPSPSFIHSEVFLSFLSANKCSAKLLTSSATCKHPHPANASLFSRRKFLTHISTSFALFLPFLQSPTHAANPASTSPPRTVFDEERDRNEAMLRQIEEQRLKSVRAAFDATLQAKNQLADLDDLIKDSRWPRISTFLRVFNNDVVRDTMEKVLPEVQSLTMDQRTQAKKLCKSITNRLISLDKHTVQLSKLQPDGQESGTKNNENINQLMVLVHEDVDMINSLIDDFQTYKP